MTDHTLPSGVAVGAPTVSSDRDDVVRPASPPRRRPGAAVIVAIVAGVVLVLSLGFGAGFATAWALGVSNGPGTSFPGGPGGGTPPQFGQGGPQEDRSLPGQRDDSSDDSGSSTDSSGS